MNRQDDCLISKSTLSSSSSSRSSSNSSSTPSSWVPFFTKVDFNVKNESRSGRLAMSGPTKRAGNVLENKVKQSGGRCPLLDRHCVRIAPTVSITFIPSHYDYSKEEKEAQWYTRPEIKEMTSRKALTKHRRMIEVAPGILETEQASKNSGESHAETRPNIYESKSRRSRSRERSGVLTGKKSDQENATLRASIISNASDATDRATTGELFELFNRSIESPTRTSKTNIKGRGEERIGTTLIFSEDCAASKHFTKKETLNKKSSAPSNRPPRPPREHQKRLSPLNHTQPTPQAWDASSRSISALKHDKLQTQVTRTRAAETQDKHSSRLGAAMRQVVRISADAASPASRLNNKLGDRAKEKAMAVQPKKHSPGHSEPVKRGKASGSPNKAGGPSSSKAVMKTSDRLERLQLELGRIRRSAGADKSRSGGMARTQNRAAA